MSISRRLFIRNAAIASTLLTIKNSAIAKATERTGIKEFYKDDFRIGTAISTATLLNNDKRTLGLIAREFDAITPENCMKWEPIRPKDNEWDWTAADKFVEFGQKNSMYIVGHNLVWHSQVPKEVFQDESGGVIKKEALAIKMQNHIAKLAGRYKGKISAWDVVMKLSKMMAHGEKAPGIELWAKTLLPMLFIWHTK